MTKERRISLRISEADFRKVEAMRNGRTLTQFFTGLIQQAVEKDRQEAESFLELLKKIDSSDLSKISMKLDAILKKIEAGISQESDINFDALIEFLAELRDEQRKNYKAIIEVISNQKGELYAQSFDRKLREGEKK